MDKMITMVVPVLNELQMTRKFFSYVAANVVIPSQILLIDDGSTENIKSILSLFSELPITYIRHGETEGVNYCWNEGIERAENPLICLMNNDVIFGKYFFKKMVLAKEHKKYGIFCPDMIRKLKSLPAIEKEKNDDAVQVISHLKRKSGWAFTIRKEITDAIKPIPKMFKMSNGDNYLWACSRLLGYEIGQVVDARLFHHGSVTVLKYPYDLQTKDWQNYLKRMHRGTIKWRVAEKKKKVTSKKSRRSSSRRTS